MSTAIVWPIGERPLDDDLIKARDACADTFAYAWKNRPRIFTRANVMRDFTRAGLPLGKGLLTLQTAKMEHTSAPSAILYLAPHLVSGRNLCPNASGCVASCLAQYSGRMRFANASKARLARTRAFLALPRQFGLLLALEARALVDRAREEHGKRARVLLRLDGGSDLGLGFAVHSRDRSIAQDLTLFDYSKDLNRARLNLSREQNYPLAFSVTRATEARGMQHRAEGGSIAIAIAHPRGAEFPPLPGSSIDGDRTGEDWALLPNGARKGLAVLLRFKGNARACALAQRAGFVFTFDQARAMLEAPTAPTARTARFVDAVATMNAPRVQP